MRLIRVASLLAVALVASSLVFAQSTSAPEAAPGVSQPAPPADSQGGPIEDTPRSRLRLGGGDLIEVSIFGVPDLTAKGRISNEGDFYMALIGYVRVAGLSPEDAQALIEKKYIEGGFLKNPHATINVLEYVTQGASLLGEVARPGIYPVLGSRRLYDIISAAGGFTANAGRTVTITHRESPDKPVVVVFSNTPDKATDANVVVFPGDTLVVSKAAVVYVVGEVTRPAGILMENQGLTVLKALAMSGGPTAKARLDAAKLIRRRDGKTEEIALPLKQILSAKAADLELQPEDIVFVPGKNIMALQTILQVATGLALRVPF
jgi:polysaccharide export outer membrane protein